jgi:single-strand DNA-binding protein
MKNFKNAIHLIGNIDNTPIIKTTITGKKMALLNLITSKNTNSNLGNKKVDTCWHKLIAVGKIAEMVEQQICKGAEIAISGKLINRWYTDVAGNKKFTTEIFAHEILLLNHKAIA